MCLMETVRQLVQSNLELMFADKIRTGRFVASGRSMMEQFRAAGGRTQEHDHISSDCRYSWESDAIKVPILGPPSTMGRGWNPFGPASVSHTLPTLPPPKTMDRTILHQTPDSKAQASTQARVTSTVRYVSTPEEDPKDLFASR